MRNRYCASREAGDSRAPFFELRLGEEDSAPPLAAASGELIPPRPEGYRWQNHLWSNEFVSFQLVLEGAKAPELSESLHARVSWPSDDSIRSEVLRMANVATDRGLVPDPLLPTDGVLMTIDRDAVPGRLDHRALLIDLFLPPEAAAGLHRGVLTLSSGERRLDL